VLVLALETSTRRGSVALVESGRLIAERSHEEPQAHGERLLGLIDDLFKEASDLKCRDLQAIAAGHGPGAFTGLRVGLALAQGLATGLGIPAIGVSSMQAMAMGLAHDLRGRRWPVLDARRGEFFVACYDADGTQLRAPEAVPKAGVEARLRQLQAELGRHSPNWLLGDAASSLDESMLAQADFFVHHDHRTDWPGAAAVGQLASLASNKSSLPMAAEYLREADAVLPKLPPSPLAQSRRD
jgi:tRNA threonylcarbamoyladenosine biosynthesis protein TsaB